MPYPIDNKLVVAVASSALFDLRESDAVFREKGIEAYRKHQRDNQGKRLPEGVVFSFIRRFLGLNDVFAEERPVEVVLLSRNDPDTGLRVFNSIGEFGLDIARAPSLPCGER